MDEQIWISIIGAGRVGAALGVLASQAGYRVRCVASRDIEDARELAARLGGETMVRSVSSAAAGSDIIFLAVPDDEIEPLCETLVRSKALRPGAVVAHCAGVLSSEALASARHALQCSVASFHPLQAFPRRLDEVRLPENTYCCIEGDEAAVAALEKLGAAMGFRTVRIRPETKALYHAAAVMACNYLTALLDAALTVAEQAGISRGPGAEAMEPLIRATVEHFFRMGSEQALTGPIARGDLRTVEAHLAALGGSSHTLRDVYCSLGAWTVALARRKGSIDAHTADRLRGMLEG